MSRYIDLEELERRIKENVPTSGAGNTPYEVDLLDWCKDECIRQGYAMPTADVAEVKHGTWYHGTENGAVYAKCSACGRKMNYSCYGYAYCALCGAKMDGESEDTE